MHSVTPTRPFRKRGTRILSIHSLRSKRKGDGVWGEPARGEAPRSKSASEASREGNGEEGREGALAAKAHVFSMY